MNVKVNVDIWDSKINSIIVHVEEGLYGLKKKACERWVEEVMEESRELCPVDTGAMQASTFVEWDDNVVEFGYDGSLQVNPETGISVSQYLIDQHEQVNWKHKEGKSAKFLEIPVMNKADELISVMEDELVDLFSDWTPKWRGRGKPRGRGAR